VRDHVTLRSRIGAEILILAKTFQAGRAPSNGANAPKNERGVTLRSKIGAEILFLAKNFQAGRAPSNGANAPKNERYITFKNWCGDSVFCQKLPRGARTKLWCGRTKK